MSICRRLLIAACAGALPLVPIAQNACAADTTLNQNGNNTNLVLKEQGTFYVDGAIEFRFWTYP
jgi:hypothetical protein